MSIPKDWTYSFVSSGGLNVTCTIPPYVWMYEQGAIKEVIVKDVRGCELRVNTTLNLATNTVEELESLVKAAKLEHSVCKVCGSGMLAHGGYYRTNDECDTCCRERITRESNARVEREQFKEKVIDTAHKAQGYKYKTVMWVHPSSGDDYALVQYSVARPTDKEIHSILKQKRSTVVNDFTITEL